MRDIPETIEGGSHVDQRGTLRFFNDLNMEPIKRFYVMEPANSTIVRGWRAHRVEQRWFYVANGIFKIQLIRIDNWEKPDKNLPIDEFIISSEDNKVLHVPIGFASSIQALEANSKLIAFSDYGIENANSDNYLYPVNYFIK